MTKLVPIVAYRSRVESVGGGLEISMPSRRSHLMSAFIGLWLGFWVFSLFQVVPQMFGSPTNDDGGPPVLFVVVWLAVWLGGGCFVLALFLWRIAGRERVIVRPDVLEIRRETFGIGWTRHYALHAVKALRVVDAADANTSFGSFGRGDPFGTRSGSLAFDYGAKTIRFGGGVDPAEAKYLLSKMIAAKPALAEQS